MLRSRSQYFSSLLDLWGDNPLARILCFNNKSLQGTVREMVGNTDAVNSPASEATTPWTDFLAEKILKPYASRFSLGDKALAFIETVPGIGESAKLRKMAWVMHVASLMSVKMMLTVNKLPVSKAEATIVRFAALTGVTTLGTTAASYAHTLSRADQDRLRNAERKLGGAARATIAAGAQHAAPGTRADGLSALFSIGNALAKGYQLKVKQDARTAVEMVGNVLQGAGDILGFRAKAFEETVFKGVKGMDIFTAEAMPEALDTLNARTLMSMRVSAIRFLLPAAIISAFWDGSDAWTSAKRGQDGLAVAQAAAVAGGVFMVASSMVAASSGPSSFRVEPNIHNEGW